MNVYTSQGYDHADVLGAAEHVAKLAHVGQVRKYTGEPYWHHCRDVAHTAGWLLQDCWPGSTRYIQAAGWLHDVVEDTRVTIDALAMIFPPTVVELVDYMTERSHEGNRTMRKKAERERLAAGIPGGGTSSGHALKLVDLCCNAPSIVEYDPSFASVFLKEAWALHEVLTSAPSHVRDWAEERLNHYQMIHDAKALFERV